MTGYLTVDVANEFVKKGWEVILISGKVNKTDRKLNNSIKQLNTVPYLRGNLIIRFITWFLCYIHVVLLILFKFRQYEFMFYTNPPFSYFAGKLVRSSFFIVVFDLYPDFLKTLGWNPKNWIFSIWANANRKYFAKASGIITLTEDMKSQIIKYSINPSKISVIPLWSGSQIFERIEHLENPFVIENNIKGKFIVMYSGNLGFGHSLDVLIKVAYELKECENILFLIIGEGAKKANLIEQAANYKLDNFKFLGWQDSDNLRFSLTSANISVVSLDSRATNVSIPSKTFNYLAAASPIIGIGSRDSELEKLILDNRVGLFFEHDQIGEIAGAIHNLYLNPELLKVYALNAQITSSKYDYNIAGKYLEVIENKLV